MTKKRADPVWLNRGRVQAMILWLSPHLSKSFYQSIRVSSDRLTIPRRTIQFSNEGKKGERLSSSHATVLDAASHCSSLSERFRRVINDARIDAGGWFLETTIYDILEYCRILTYVREIFREIEKIGEGLCWIKEEEKRVGSFCCIYIYN